MAPTITLTTDFGLKDTYVASVKAVILNINPAATIIDISHLIEPYNIKQASHIIGSVYKDFSSGTIHVAVVDPGVGSSREAIIIQTSKYCFVGPNNGIFSDIMMVDGPELESMNKGWNVYQIKSRKYFLTTASHTFHARDIYAPVAAYLSQGVPAEDFGPVFTKIERLVINRPEIISKNELNGEIVHIDNYGNLITDITREYIELNNATVQIKNYTIYEIKEYYSQGSGLIALFGSTGRLEISYVNGNAARYSGSKIGDAVKVLVP